METPRFPSTHEVQEGGSAGEIMASVFLDMQGVVMIEYLERGHTVTRLYYSQQLCRLKEAVKKKRCGKLSTGILLLHDNAPAHTSNVAVSKATHLKKIAPWTTVPPLQ